MSRNNAERARLPPRFCVKVWGGPFFLGNRRVLKGWTDGKAKLRDFLEGLGVKHVEKGANVVVTNFRRTTLDLGKRTAQLKQRLFKYNTKKKIYNIRLRRVNYRTTRSQGRLRIQRRMDAAAVDDEAPEVEEAAPAGARDPLLRVALANEPIIPPPIDFPEDFVAPPVSVMECRRRDYLLARGIALVEVRGDLNGNLLKMHNSTILAAECQLKELKTEEIWRLLKETKPELCDYMKKSLKLER